MKGLLRGLTEKRAATDPGSTDWRLLGRTYAIPFDDVWSAATTLAAGALRGWSLLAADDQQGVIEASTRSRLTRREGEVRVQIGLDENAQTRVDAWSSSLGRSADLGRSRRTLGRFFEELDRTLAVKPGQILDGARARAWLDQ
ncbi:MAG TPA: hypothetical protein VLA09_06695 [Longimicrobiales bacterium]|nr:hypothetical protein [Longimicrobiales bacterium]